MTNDELEDLKQLFESTISALSKHDAQELIQRLEFAASKIKEKVSPYLFVKLGEAISYAKEASGQVQQKDHWTSCARQSWRVFESGVRQGYNI